MRHPKFLILILLSAFLFSIPACAQSQTLPEPKISNHIALRAARLLDVTRGVIIENPTILIEGERIIAVGSNLNIPADTKVINLGNAELLPGLIDVHTHITYHFDKTGHFGLSGDSGVDETLKYAAENARKTLEAGFTTIRNLAAYGLADITLRDKINRGELIGPRMLVSGEPLTYSVIQGVERKEERISRIREFIKRRAAEGIDVIKIFEGVDEYGEPLFASEEIKAAVEEAAKSKLKVAVHAHETAAVKAAVRGGCASIEHGTFLDDEAIRLLAKSHTALVPTLYLPTHYLEHKNQFSFDNSTWDFFEKLQSTNFGNFKRARKAGVWIVSGSDAVAGLHGQNSREIVWLVKAGMKPAEAIRAATADAAKLLELDEKIGEIKQGKIADIIAVQGNPLLDITDLEKVVFVMKSGKIIRNEANK